MKIIAFGHRKRVGKDTCAKFAMSEIKIRYPKVRIKKVGFADKVKDIAHQLYGWAGLKGADYYEQHEEEREIVLPAIGKTPRQVWIGVGNGIRSAVGYDGTWFDYVINTYKDLDYLIISDLRFVGEAEAIRKVGGILVRVDCPWSPKVEDGADEALAAYNHWTTEIVNHTKGNQKVLYTAVLDLLENYL